MINFAITVYAFVFMAICALFLAMIIGWKWYWKQNNFCVSESAESTYLITMIILVVIAGFMLFFGIRGFDIAKYEATDYDIEAMVNDLRSEGVEVIEEEYNKNYLRDTYFTFTGKTKYYWYHNGKAEKYLINKKSDKILKSEGEE